MKYRIFLFFSLLCLMSQNIIGQNCYSLPFSGTGIVSSGFDDLNSASCELRSSFPVEFQEDFSVYSISQYVISRYYGEEYWSQLVVEIDSIIGAQSPNYLLFIWSQNGDQLYSEGEVRLSLPKNGAFDCASDLKRESIRTQLQALLNESSTASNPLEYEQGELSAINSLKETVEYLVDCCDPQNRSSCSICMVSEEFDNMFDENMGKYSESLLINDPSPMVFYGNQVSEISGANYSIAVYDSITVTWEGGTESISDLLADFFASGGLESSWEAIILGDTICTLDNVEQDAINSFFSSPPANPTDESGRPIHKVFVTITSTGDLLVKSITANELYQPIYLSNVEADLSPFWVVYPACPVLTVRNHWGGLIPYGSFTPTGDIVTLPAGVKGSFHPADGIWPGGCLNGFRTSDGQLYWGAHKDNYQNFLGYRKVSLEEDSIIYYSGPEYYWMPSSAADPEKIIAALAIENNNCKVQVHERQWSPSDWANVFDQEDNPGEGEGVPILNTLSDRLPPESYTGGGVLPVEPCMSDTALCRIQYGNHPYFDSNTPLSRALNSNPCLASTLSAYDYYGTPEDGQYIDGLKNICAGLLAFGFLPTLAPVLSELLPSIAKDKVKDGMIGFSIDLSLQVVLRYYWPSDGNENITWEEAADPSSLNYSQAGSAAVDGLLESIPSLKAKYFLQGLNTCLYDGFTNNEGEAQSFDIKECASGAFYAVLFGGIIDNFPQIKSYLFNLSKKKLVDGIIRFVGDLNPGSVNGLYSFNNGFAYSVYKSIRGDVPFVAEDMTALLDVDGLNASEIKDILNSSPMLKNLLFSDSDLWLSLRKADIPKERKADFIRELEGNDQLANFIKQQDESLQDGLVQAWHYADEVYPSRQWCANN
ncbi:MAG: hypothetical protein NXI25_15430 [bacterium]|nr:hypothetical protein [bacterium]